MKFSKILFIYLSFLLSGFYSKAACTLPAGVAGQYQIKSGTGIQYCDGSAWVSTAQFSASASCAASEEGKVKYNPADGSLQYCSSTLWSHMKGARLTACPAGTANGTIKFDTASSKLRLCSNGTWFDLSAGTANYQTANCATYLSWGTCATEAYCLWSVADSYCYFNCSMYHTNAACTSNQDCTWIIDSSGDFCTHGSSI